MSTESGLSPLLIIEGKIQTRISRFLSLKEILVNLIRRHSSPVIRDRAQILLNTQVALEKSSKEVFATINILKSGAWTFSDISRLGQFYYSIERQIKNVSSLQQESLRGRQEVPSISYLPYLLGALAIIGMAFLIKK
ncbi:MAG: hypothetical protein DDT19_01468 [Syntrophomonadaceae bacterium]|nr:hypothetical protein [Bacillota bacterium]